MEQAKTRAFISIDLPQNVKNKIKKIQNQLDKKNLFIGKFTKIENLHLTLKFLGELSEEQLKKTIEKLKQLKFKKIKISLGKLGIFSEKFIRIIWIHLQGQEILKLQKLIDENLKSIFQKENSFMSHLTIVRVKRVKDKTKLLKELKKIKPDQDFEINKIYLKKSELTPKGPIYTNLLKINL